MTTTVHEQPFTLETIRPMVIEILRKDPERRIGGETGVSCQYWDFDRECPDCVIGRLMARLGLDVKNLIGDKNNENLTVQTTLAPLFENDALSWMSRVQYAQDKAVQWRELADRIEAGKI